MNIVVCVKRVPDTETRVRIGSDGRSISSEGVKYVLNPYDEFAIEAALQTVEAAGGGEVALVTYGGEESKETLRSGLAMGADRAVLLKGEPTMDGLATAAVLKSELETAEPDLVLFGVKAIDDDQQQVGLMTGELLGRPTASSVTELSVTGGVVQCRVAVEGGTQLIEMDLPAVATITKGKYEPRYASLKGIMAAKRKPLEEKDVSDGEPGIVVESLELPPTRPEGRIVGEGAEAAPELVRLLREEAKVI